LAARKRGTVARHSPEVDAYIAGSAEFARPILGKIREAFHAGCPALEERLKWGVPSFEYNGLLGGMAAFKKHVAFGFWKSRLMEGFAERFAAAPRASFMGARLESVKDLPPKRVLVAFVRQAVRLNEEAIRDLRAARPSRPSRVAVPRDLALALAANARAKRTFEAFPPSAKRDYAEWIVEAKTEATRRRRLDTAVQWLAEGKRRNWKYER
jgi:uncharacterized protein YdeI (YjbR/CyaY-like superfamily)